jgi:sulfopyruvate decarboxylase subunit alpha
MKNKKDKFFFPLVSSSEEFAKELMNYFDWFSGVPDSVLKVTQSHLNNFYFSTRENHAVGMAFGSLIGGKKPCLLIQNSGLGLSIDSILGLFSLHKKGLVLIVSNRGELDWEEVQHKDWAEVTTPILNAMNFKIINFQNEGLKSISLAHDYAYKGDQIVVIIVKRGNLDE